MRGRFLCLICCILLLFASCDKLETASEKAGLTNDVPENYTIVRYHLDGAPIIYDSSTFAYYYLDEERDKAYRIFTESIEHYAEVSVSDSLQPIEYQYFYDAETKTDVPLSGYSPAYFNSHDPFLVRGDIEFRVPFTYLIKIKENKKSEYTFFGFYLGIPKNAEKVIFDRNYCFDDIYVENGNERFEFTSGMLLDMETRTLLYNYRTADAIVLPDGLKAIGPHAFRGVEFSIDKNGDVTSLLGNTRRLAPGNFFEYIFKRQYDASITLPESLEYIDHQAFSGWLPNEVIIKGLNPNFIVDGNILLNKEKTIAILGLSHDVEIPDSVEEVYPYAFLGSTIVKVSNNIKTVGDFGFYEAKFKEKQIRLFKLETVGHYGFYDAEGSAMIGNALTSVGAYGFYSSELSKLSESLQYIGKFAFSYCDFSQGITIPGGVKNISEFAFASAESHSVRIRDGVRYIGNYAFAEFDGVAEVIIPPSVTRIGDYAFVNCIDLESVVIEDSDDNSVSIGESAFEHCVNLEKVLLPDSVYWIDSGAFKDCKKARISAPKDSKAYGIISARYPSNLEVSIW